MTQNCNIINSKKIIFGNKVSHSNRKTKRKFIPNLNSYKIYSYILGYSIKIKSSYSAIRSIDFKNGLDGFLLNTKSKKLSSKALKLKRKILKLRGL